MDGPTAGVVISSILGLAGVVVTALFTRAKNREVTNSMSDQQQPKMEQSFERETEVRFEQRLERIQQDVNELDTQVALIQAEQTRKAQDITGLRNEISTITRDMGELRRLFEVWVAKHSNE